MAVLQARYGRCRIADVQFQPRGDRSASWATFFGRASTYGKRLWEIPGVEIETDAGTMVVDVTVGESPQWMQARLRKAGMRPERSGDHQRRARSCRSIR